MSDALRTWTDFADGDEAIAFFAAPRTLLLDYDGTLSPFVDDPAKAVPYPGVRSRLAALMKREGTRLVIVTGRASGEGARLLGLEPRPEIWGCHGGERLLPDGRLIPPDIASEQQHGLEEADRIAAALGLAARLEHKPGCLAFHVRGYPPEAQAELFAAVRPDWIEVAGRSRLALNDFDGGMELRVEGFNKGDAVRRILADTEDGRRVAYLGDDLTDEDAFAALGERGLSVLVRTEPRPTTAALWLRPPEELLAFLDRCLDAS